MTGRTERDWDDPRVTEEGQIEELTRELLDEQVRDYPAGTGEMKRKVHNKTNGALVGKLCIKNVPRHLRCGLFKEDKALDVLIRTSNGSGKDQADSVPDVRGFALKAKLADVPWEALQKKEEPGATQDFLFANHDVFFVPNLAAYLPLTRQLDKGNPAGFFFNGSVNPFNWRWRAAWNLFRGLSKSVRDQLVVQYWSQIAFGYGPHKVKFSLKPTGDLRPGRSSTSSRNFLREAMADHLKDRESRFDFLVQLQTDPDAEPVDDPTVSWDSPFQKVGELVIPPQELTPERDALAEAMSFSPGHTVDHPAQGEIGHARLSVYRTLAEKRLEQNSKHRK